MAGSVLTIIFGTPQRLLVSHLFSPLFATTHIQVWWVVHPINQMLLAFSW